MTQPRRLYPREALEATFGPVASENVLEAALNVLIDIVFFGLA